jgi:hypothetical protein
VHAINNPNLASQQKKRAVDAATNAQQKIILKAAAAALNVGIAKMKPHRS